MSTRPRLASSRQRFVRCGQWSDRGNATRRRTKSAASDFNQINLQAGTGARGWRVSQYGRELLRQTLLEHITGVEECFRRIAWNQIS